MNEEERVRDQEIGTMLRRAAALGIPTAKSVYDTLSYLLAVRGLGWSDERVLAVLHGDEPEELL
jgi:hypothetical protein